MDSEPLILIIEDNIDSLSILRTSLEYENYKVVTALNENSVMEILEKYQPDLILQDLTIPNITYQKLNEIIKKRTNSKIPIIALTGFLDKYNEEQHIDYFAGFLSKPIEAESLLKLVKVFLPKINQPHATEIGKRILIIDDNPLQLKVQSLQLSYYGFILETADSVDDALNKINSQPPDLIICDVLMPKTDGFEFCVKMKTETKHANIPIILMSSQYLDQDDKELGKKSGAADYISRTADLNELIEVIHRCFKNRNDQTSIKINNKKIINDDHRKRLINQLERQIITKNDLIRRCALQASHLTMLGGIANILTKNMAIDWNIENIISTCLDLAGISRGGLYLTDRDGKMQLDKIIGYEFSDYNKITNVYKNQEILTKIKEAKDVIELINHPNSNNFIMKRNPSDETTALLAPFILDDKCSGAILLESQNAKFNNNDSIIFARNLAAQIGQAIQLAKVFERIYYSEERYRVLMENASCGIFIFNYQGKLLEINKQGEKLLNCTKDKILNQDFNQFISKFDQEKNIINNIINSKITGPEEMRIKPLNSPERIVEYSGAEIKTKTESVLMIMATDVSERNKLRKQTLITDKLATVGTLAASVAHEINNPISWVMTNLVLIKNHLNQLIHDFKLAKHDFDKNQQITLIESLLNKIEISFDFNELINESLQGVERVRDIVKNMKAFSRMDSFDSTSTNQLNTVDIHEVLNVAISMASIEFKFRARLEKQFENNLPPVTSNSGKLHQVFLNLIINASQAIPDGHLQDNFIIVATKLDGPFIRVDITDSGQGISDEVLPHIFEPFFTTKPVEHGTGLGLSICHEIITELKGQIKVQSVVNKGTTFSVYLPILSHSTKKMELANLINNSGRKNILIIDDELYLLKSIQNILRQKYNTTTALGGKNAIDLLKKQGPFDLILCDLQMPEVNGAEIYQYVKENFPGDESKIIYITGGSFTPKLNEFISSIKNFILDKPFTHDDLLKSVEALC